jgi:hypothetical protein
VVLLHRYKGYFSVPPAFTMLSSSGYPSPLNMEVTCSSETSSDFQWTTERYISEDNCLNVGTDNTLDQEADVTPHRSSHISLGWTMAQFTTRERERERDLGKTWLLRMPSPPAEPDTELTAFSQIGP